MNTRGLTLIEVLASVVILTMLAVACMPMLQSAKSATHQDPRLTFDLGQLADAFIENPQEHGIQDIGVIDVIELAWPETSMTELHRDPMTLQLRRIEDGDNGVTHAWLVFEYEGATVCRWIGPEQFNVDDSVGKAP